MYGKRRSKEVTFFIWRKKKERRNIHAHTKLKQATHTFFVWEQSFIKMKKRRKLIHLEISKRLLIAEVVFKMLSTF